MATTSLLRHHKSVSDIYAQARVLSSRIPAFNQCNYEYNIGVYPPLELGSLASAGRSINTSDGLILSYVLLFLCVFHFNS